MRKAAERRQVPPFDEHLLARCWAWLSEEQESLLRLRHRDGLTYAEIGRRHGRSGTWASQQVRSAESWLALLLTGGREARYCLEMEQRRAWLLETMRTRPVSFDELQGLGVSIRWVRDIKALEEQGHKIDVSKEGYVLRAGTGPSAKAAGGLSKG